MTQTATPIWKPKPESLHQVLSVIREQAPDGDRAKMEQKLQLLQAMQKHPEFNNYLAYILSSLKDLPSSIPISAKEREQLRQQAGLKLKNNIKEVWKSLPPTFREYVKHQVVSVIGDPSQPIRNTVGTIIATICAQDPDSDELGPLLKQVVMLIENSNPNTVDGAFNAIYKICEDAPRALSSEKLGRPLLFLIPKFISMFLSPRENVRKYALGAVNVFLCSMPPALAQNMDKYMENLFKLTRDSNPEIKKRVCQAFVLLLEVGINYLQSCMNDVITFMLKCTKDDDEIVSLEACEFWSVYCEAKGANLKVLGDRLPELVPVLLKGMVYSEIDILILGGDEEDEHIPDRSQDIRPRFATPAVKGAAAEIEEESDDDWEEDPSDWNLRKCSAASLDTLANVYKNALLVVLLPLLQEKLSSKKWEVRESGILALGAIAEGCIKGIEGYLKDLVPYLIQLLRDQKPLVRSITCWTLSRYAKWVMAEPEDEKYFRPLMIELLKRVLDPNKKVQEAACSAFATLEEEAQERLIPYLGGILSNLMHAFKSYQAKNMLILYDAIGTLAEAVGSELNKPAYVNILMPPLMLKWERLQDDDRNIFPLLECLTSVAQALGTGFAKYAQPVFTRCLQIIEKNLVQQQKAILARKKNPTNPEVDFPDKEFIVCALDLLSGLAEGLEASIESLVGSNPIVLRLLFECIRDPDPDVRQSAFALLGDLAKACIGHIKPHLKNYIPVAAQNLQPKYISVCNNASWAIGEIAVKIGSDMKTYIALLMGQLIPIMNTPTLIPSLLENTAITIGRLGLVAPDAVAPFLDKFAQQWCVYLARIRENTEKEHAFRGLCSVIAKNPKGVLPAFPAFCQSIGSWNKPKPEVRHMFQQILQSFKKMLGASWPAYLGKCPAPLQEQLTNAYKLK